MRTNLRHLAIKAQPSEKAKGHLLTLDVLDDYTYHQGMAKVPGRFRLDDAELADLKAQVIHQNRIDLVLLGDEIPLLGEALAGLQPGGRRMSVYFRDVRHYFTLYSDGMHILKLDGYRYQEYHITFPTPAVLGPLYDRAVSSLAQGEPYQETVSQADLCYWRKETAPHILTVFEDPRVKTRFYADLKHPDQTGLAEEYKRLQRIARTYSDGNLIKLYLIFDSLWNAERFAGEPTSYTWRIENEDNKCLWWGGLIAFDHSARWGRTTWRYSIHT
jgi:hypothetical protein